MVALSPVVAVAPGQTRADRVILDLGIVGCGHIDREQCHCRVSGRSISQPAGIVVSDHVHVALIRDPRLIAHAWSVAGRVVDRIVDERVVLGRVARRRRQRIASAVEIGKPDADIVTQSNVILNPGVCCCGTVIAGAADQYDATARSLVGAGIGVPDHQIILDLRSGAISSLDPVLGDVAHRALADHGVLLNIGSSRRSVDDNSAFLVIVDIVALDVSAGVATKDEINCDAVLSSIERRFTDIRYDRILDVDLGAIVDDAEIIGAMDIGVVHAAFAADVIDTDIASGCVDIAAYRPVRIDQRCRQIDVVAHEPSSRTGRTGDRFSKRSAHD